MASGPRKTVFSTFAKDAAIHGSRQIYAGKSRIDPVPYHMRTW